MATLDDSALESLRQLNGLRDRAKELRERGRKALCAIPETFTDREYKKLEEDFDLSSKKWVSGPHPIDVALWVRVLNHRDLGNSEFNPDRKHSDRLANAITTLFTKDSSDDNVPILTAARSMHALVSRPQTVFSTATFLCYYRIVRELYLAAFPNWRIGAARAGDGGRVSAFVTGECVRAILAFQDAIRHTITFLRTTRKFYEEIERLKAIPDVDRHLDEKPNNKESRWKKCLGIEFERVMLDWYAANDLRHNVIALDLSRSDNANNTPQTGIAERSLLPSIFPLASGERISQQVAETALDDLPSLLTTATEQAYNNIDEATKLIDRFWQNETERSKGSDKQRLVEITKSAHELGLEVINEALCEAKSAKAAIDAYSKNPDLPGLLKQFNDQYVLIYKRIQRIIEPANRYIQDVLNRELAQAANSAKFDAGELLFAAACFGALTKWKQNEQLADARRLLTGMFPEDGRLQTSRPFQSTSQGLRLMPIAFEMTRCFAQLLQKDFTEDLDPKLVRKILNAFEEHPITLDPGENDAIGWNFRGAPESQKPSVWVTSIAVFALDRTVRMLNERINAMVLRHFNVDWPNVEIDPFVGDGDSSGGKLHLNECKYPSFRTTHK